VISIRNVKKRFGAQVVLDGIDIDVPEGSNLAIVGPSGTGKSVLLKIITGLMDADCGEVIIGKDVMSKETKLKDRQRINRRMGVLFQAAALFDSLTVLDNVAFPLRSYGELSEKEIIQKSLKSISQVGMSGYELAYPGEIPMGMKKRVGIARALVTDPEIILFDEPNTGLDPFAGQEIYDLIKETHQQRKFTGIVISHEIPEVFQVCDKVAMLYGGKVQLMGDIDKFIHSDNAYVRQFVEGRSEGPIAVR
jgi:phospholipid/cholesterol/gamma-HCH transport system ATP-binding protein